MKITYMLKREDFYQINQTTLKEFYRDSTTEKKLYIYPELNAIVIARPSKTVREYLYTEFRVNGSFLKRLLVRIYAGVLLNSGGLFASRSLKLKTDANRDTLIYPCNKKYRVFDFAKNQVSVFAKDGFPKDGLANEIEFRTKNTAEFIPGLLCSDDTGYTETIIDGCPVARAGVRMEELSDRAFELWSEYIKPHTEQVPSADYAERLSERIVQLKQRVQELEKPVNLQNLDTLCADLLGILRAQSENVPVSLSHGDLQPGNIWVENGTDKLYIIDWESCEPRSIWYDRAALYEGIRKTDGISRYARGRDLVHATVLLEDVIFRLTELTTLPHHYGSAEFDAYIENLQGGNRDV